MEEIRQKRGEQTKEMVCTTLQNMDVGYYGSTSSGKDHNGQVNNDTSKMVEDGLDRRGKRREDKETSFFQI